eukprot:3704576-Amphidinium_carterae.1
MADANTIARHDHDRTTHVDPRGRTLTVTTLEDAGRIRVHSRQPSSQARPCHKTYVCVYPNLGRRNGQREVLQGNPRRMPPHVFRGFRTTFPWVMSMWLTDATNNSGAT